MDYFYTITLKPEYYLHTAETLATTMKEAVLRVLTGYKHTSVIELTKVQVVHIHGIVELSTKSKDPKRNFKNLFQNLEIVGHIDISSVDNYYYVTGYIMKDVGKTDKIILQNSVIFDSYNLQAEIDKKKKHDLDICKKQILTSLMEMMPLHERDYFMNLINNV